MEPNSGGEDDDSQHIFHEVIQESKREDSDSNENTPINLNLNNKNGFNQSILLDFST
jgi:hypothetical protein